MAEQIAFEADLANSISVKEDLRSPHPLVKATRDAFDATKDGYASYWRSGRREHLDIDVSKCLLRRALRIADALIKGFARGWQVALGKGDDRKSYVTILGQQLSFGIRETFKKVPNPPATPRRLPDGTIYTPWQSKYNDKPSGHLSFVTRNSWGHAVDKSWVESKTRPLEERLTDFIVSLVAIAQEAVECAKRREQEERAWREAEEIRRAAEEQRSAEARRVQALDQQSVKWERSRRLHDYLVAVRAAAESQPGVLQADSHFSNWLAWAEGYARSIDPLQQSLDKLLSIAESPHETA